MNKNYNLKLDLQFRCNNQTMKFNQFDNNTSDFFIKISSGGKSFDVEKAIVVLAVIKPSGKVSSQFIEVKNDAIYAELKSNMRDEIGVYIAQAMLVLEDERVVTDTISYEVNESKIISAFIEDAETQEEYALLTDMLNRLSIIETNEDNRKNNFSKIQEEFEAIKNNHNELVATQTSKRVDEIIQPVVEENVKKHTEKVINELSDKVVIVDSKIEEIEEFIENKNNIISNTITTANSKVNEAISKIPPKSELIGPKGDKGDRGERGERGLQGIQGLQGPIGKTGATGPQGERGEQGLQGPIGEQGPIGPQGEKGDTPSIAHLETAVSNKVNEIETRFNALTSKQQQDAEVIDARDGETSLKARLDRDIEKAKQIYVDVEGSHISTDSSVGYAKNIEILGNTIQDASNLADIRSVGDKVEGQELYKIDVVSCGENIFNNKWELGSISRTTGENVNSSNIKRTSFIKIGGSNVITPCMPKYSKSAGARYIFMYFYDKNKKYLGGNAMGDKYIRNSFTPPVGSEYVRFTMDTTITECEFEVFLDKRNFVFEGNLIESTPYQEDKLTILSPVQLEKVGDVADRLICKDGVWGVEKNIGTLIFNGSESWKFRNDLSSNVLSVFELNDVSLINQNAICNLFNVKTSYTEEELIRLVPNGNLVVTNINNLKLENNEASGFKSFLSNNNLKLKISAESEFIQLPHDQQVKLRTFAGQTNISFLTEIEGTIKAQVPKSIGATVNTHTEQIDILNKKVFKIEEIDQVQQDMMILESDLRILDIELALMEHMPITLNLGENSMLRSATYFNFLKNHIVNETYSKDYLENVMNKYLATNRLTQEEYNELYKMLYPPVYDIELPIEY